MITYKGPINKIKPCVSCAELNCAGASLLILLLELPIQMRIFSKPMVLMDKECTLEFFYETGGQRYETNFEHIWNLEPWVLVVTLACCYHGGWLPDAFIYKNIDMPNICTCMNANAENVKLHKHVLKKRVATSYAWGW